MHKRELMDLVQTHHPYLPKAKPLEKLFLYEEYMRSRDLENWFSSEHVPMKEVFLLFGFLSSMEPEFNGEPEEFLLRYGRIFTKLKAFRESNLSKIELPDTIKSCIAGMFDEISLCARDKDKATSNATSIILHVFIPGLFVIWDENIREYVLGDANKIDGRNYAFEFLPEIQEKQKQMHHPNSQRRNEHA